MFKRYHQLSKPERHDLWQAAWRLLVVRVNLLGGIKSTLARQDRRGCHIGDTAANHAKPDTALDPWRRRALALKRIAPRIPGTHCLARALALRGWMRSAGLDAELKIGVRTGANGLESHAWVELDGDPVDETGQKVATYNTVEIGQDPTRPTSWRP